MYNNLVKQIKPKTSTAPARKANSYGLRRHDNKYSLIYPPKIPGTDRLPEVRAASSAGSITFCLICHSSENITTRLIPSLE